MFFRYKIEFYEESQEEECCDKGIVFANSTTEAVERVIEDYCEDKSVNKIELSWLSDDNCVCACELQDLLSCLENCSIGPQMQEVLDNLGEKQ